MHPDLFTIPLINYSVKSYGMCVMIGFLTAAWLAMRRAMRVKADPDLVLNISFIGLMFGLIGARLFYVIHYWQSDFAHAPNKLWAILDVSAGGFEFLGSVLGAVPAVTVYLWLKKESLRVYLDILAPGLMWGLAFGRVGCFLNGCCFGGVCELPWAVRFPYGSPAFVRHWEERSIPLPAELLVTGLDQRFATPVPQAALNLSLQQRQAPILQLQTIERQVRQLDVQIQMAQEASDASRAAELKSQREALARQAQRVNIPDGLKQLWRAQSIPSREHPERFPASQFGKDIPRTSLTELKALAANFRSLPVHPTQLYSAISALLLSGVLSGIFRVRRRHGVVFGVMLCLYPCSRVLEEMIRTDNPRDTAGLTISQFVSILIFLTGAIYLFVTYRLLPQLSPYAKAFVPPTQPSSPADGRDSS